LRKKKLPGKKLRDASIVLRKRFGRERELGICILYSARFVNQEKESVFLRIRKGKHFPAIKPFFFL